MKQYILSLVQSGLEQSSHYGINLTLSRSGRVGAGLYPPLNTRALTTAAAVDVSIVGQVGQGLGRHVTVASGLLLLLLLLSVILCYSLFL